MFTEINAQFDTQYYIMKEDYVASMEYSWV